MERGGKKRVVCLKTQAQPNCPLLICHLSTEALSADAVRENLLYLSPMLMKQPEKDCEKGQDHISAGMKEPLEVLLNFSIEK